MRSDGVWKKYYTRLCSACYAAKVLPLDMDYTGVARLTCPSCGIDTEDDYDGIYSTSFPGSREQVEVEAPFCSVHAAEYRIWVTAHAQERIDVDGAPEPHQHERRPEQVLRDLGRVP